MSWDLNRIGRIRRTDVERDTVDVCAVDVCAVHDRRKDSAGARQTTKAGNVQVQVMCFWQRVCAMQWSSGWHSDPKRDRFVKGSESTATQVWRRRRGVYILRVDQRAKGESLHAVN